MAQFPSSIISFPTRVNGQVIDAGDINSPDGEITALETKVGVDNSTDVNSLDYLIKSSVSNGGGHIQTANKGGTGQTTYSKGDLLVGSSSSVLTKLAVGADGLAVVADSTQATGIGYAAVATAQVIQNQTNTYAIASVLSASVYGITFPAIVSVLTQGQGFQVRFPTANASSMIALQVSSLVAQRIKMPDLTNPAVGAISSSMIGILENDGTNWQLVSRVTGDAPTYASGTATKNSADASTTQTIAHGLGRVPKYIKITAIGSSGASASPLAIATYDGTTQNSTSIYVTGGGPVQTATNTFTLNATNTSGTTVGVITFDATNISIVWTKSGSPSGTYFMVWEAQ